MKKLLCVLACLLCACLCLTGCSKDELLDAYDDVLHVAGRVLLTQDIFLKGDRDFGADSYVGTYEADYKDFDGGEYLFGGTGLERARGDSVTLRCSLTVDKGEAELIFRQGAERIVLLEDSGELDTTLELPGGSNYICFKGENFSGSLQLELK